MITLFDAQFKDKLSRVHEQQTEIWCFIENLTSQRNIAGQ